MEPLTRYVLAAVVVVVVLIVVAIAVAVHLRATPWQEYTYEPFTAVPPPVAFRPAHHALPWRREVSDWLLDAAADALVNLATISKGLPA